VTALLENGALKDALYNAMINGHEGSLKIYSALIENLTLSPIQKRQLYKRLDSAIHYILTIRRSLAFPRFPGRFA
jgi:hypothetical protein